MFVLCCHWGCRKLVRDLTEKRVEFVFVNQSTDAYMTDIEPDYSESELATMQAENIALKKQLAEKDAKPRNWRRYAGGEGYRNREETEIRMHRTYIYYVRYCIQRQRIMQRAIVGCVNVISGARHLHDYGY
jgi:hypothetical protein